MITKLFPLLEDILTLLNVECNDKLLMKYTCLKKLMLPSQKREDKQAIRILFDIIVMRKVPGQFPRTWMAPGHHLGPAAARMM
jgi:hypothetical protein